MKDFMLVFIGANYDHLNLSPEEMQQRMGSWMGWQEKMQKAGVVKDGNALTNDIRRVAGPDRVQTDMPSAEVKELIGGYYVIQARDLNHATEIAQDFPDYDLGGTVEIREVLVFEQ